MPSLPFVVEIKDKVEPTKVALAQRQATPYALKCLLRHDGYRGRPVEVKLEKVGDSRPLWPTSTLASVS